MSTFDKIKEFLVRIVKDDEFRTSVEAQPTPAEQSQLLKESGYDFTPSEFDSAAIKILELAEEGLFTDLSESELVAVTGGQTLGQAFDGNNWWWRPGSGRPGFPPVTVYGGPIPGDIIQ
jgi:predicted ribosomally synthesized peptide with nif11-like leader